MTKKWLLGVTVCALALVGACADDDGDTGLAPVGDPVRDTPGDTPSTEQPDTPSTPDTPGTPDTPVDMPDGMPVASNTIVDIAAANEDFETLVAALQRVDLVDALAGEGPFTVFAPTDDAFEALGVDLSTISDEALTEILLYHVVQADVPSSAIPSSPPIAETMAELSVWFDTSDGVRVNEANVTAADIDADNGVIHVIDSVLLPPDAVTFAGYAGLSGLGGALGEAGLVEALQAEGPFTIFAPTNDAFGTLLSALGVQGVDEIDDAVLDTVLKYHVVAGAAVDSGSIPAKADTLADLSLLFDTSAGVAVNGSDVAIADIKVTNGIIHVVGDVLLPMDIPTAATVGGFDSLVAALVEADLVGALEGAGPFTVFAPTDDAFGSFLGAVGAADVTEVPDAALTETLLYHVVGASVLAGDIAEGLSLAPTLSTSLHDDAMTLLINNAAGTVNVNAATVALTDIKTLNGVIHVVDSVITVPTAADMVSIAGLSDLGGFVGAASGDLGTVLAGDGPFTVFAPTNDAFSSVDMPTNADDLRDALLYHVVGAAVLSTELTDGTVQAVSGQNISIQTSPIAIQNAGVAIPDVVVRNGVVHVVDAVLIP